MDFEYGIIGGGPAGYTAALNLAKQGHSVIIFERNKLGGTCMNNGCIPTKSFLHSAEVYSKYKNLEEMGLSIDKTNFDFSKVIEKKDKIIEKIRKALELSIKNTGIQVIYEEAKILDNNHISTKQSIYNIQNIIIATGSEPKEIKGLEFDHKFILNSDDILNLSKLPKSILIVGSGAIGIEWARIFSKFDVNVTIIEMSEHLIPLADIEVSKRIERIFKQQNIKYFLKNSINKIEDNKVTLTNETVIEPEIILIATGRKPINIPKDTNAQILGDASGEILLAHYAIHQAKNLTLNIPFRKDLTPSIIYGNPEIAWIGLREQDIDDSYKKIMLPITALGKSWCDEATDGFIKLILKDNLIYGAHIISNEASSLIHILLLAMQNNISIDKLKEICFAHPTYAEGIFEIINKI